MIFNGDQSKSLMCDSVWLFLQSCENAKLQKYILLAALTNFTRTFGCSRYIIILDRCISRLLFFQMVCFSSKKLHYMLLILTGISYIISRNNYKRLYHHNFHYWGYVSLSSLNNNSTREILISSIIYWIGAYTDLSEFSSLYPLVKVIIISIKK